MIDFDRLEQDILEGAAAGLYKGAKLVARRAKQRAPVRNIFGNTYRFRAKTGDELTADFAAVPTSALAAMAEKGPGRFLTRWQGPKRVRADMERREWESAQELLAAYEAGEDSPLTRQGAHEIRSGRANFHSVREGSAVTVGGRLRGEIRALKPSGSGDVLEAWVISPTPYAKYMEFGTRHNRAHPYLRPALEESHEDIRSLVSREVAQAAKKAAGKRVNVDIRLVL